ncbi:MAG TPA: STAS domain-containing protein [Gaiellales bacterium]|jgi:anti-sigma B factor antagonist|nr:STAS domain-containing protein [Gaiellales bacterium]
MSKLETATTTSDGRATVVLTGTLDISTIDQALRELAGARAEAPAVVIDMRQIDFIDSSGLSVIAQTARQATETGFTLSVVPNQQARRLMEITGIASHVHIEDRDA